MQNKEYTQKVFISISIFLILLLGVVIVFAIQLNNQNTVFKTILTADTEVSEASISGQKALDFYTEASLSYEKTDYNLVESNCRLARGYFSDTSQKYKDIGSGLESSGIDDKLVDIYVEEMNLLAEIQWNMYEACEHFESASRYYNTYYNTNVPSGDVSYDMGGQEIEAMNEKIDLHDQNIRKYNDLLSDYTIELKKRL